MERRTWASWTRKASTSSSAAWASDRDRLAPRGAPAPSTRAGAGPSASDSRTRATAWSTLSSSLAAAGHPVVLLEFRYLYHSILERVRAARPVVVGVADLRVLPAGRPTDDPGARADGIDVHMTMGGIYPSLCPDEVLVARRRPRQRVPRSRASTRSSTWWWRPAPRADWHRVVGLAHLDDAGEVRETGLRTLVEDLDTLPLNLMPLRAGARPRLADHAPAARQPGLRPPVLLRSIHTFYRGAPGRKVGCGLRRSRPRSWRCAPSRGARGCSSFRTTTSRPCRAGKRWAAELADEIERRGLSEHAHLEDELPGGVHRAGVPGECARRAVPRLHGPRVRHRRRPGGPQQADRGARTAVNVGPVEFLNGPRPPLRLRLHAVRPVDDL